MHGMLFGKMIFPSEIDRGRNDMAAQFLVKRAFLLAVVMAGQVFQDRTGHRYIREQDILGVRQREELRGHQERHQRRTRDILVQRILFINLFDCQIFNFLTERFEPEGVDPVHILDFLILADRPKQANQVVVQRDDTVDALYLGIVFHIVDKIDRDGAERIFEKTLRQIVRPEKAKRALIIGLGERDFSLDQQHDLGRPAADG